MEISDLQKIKDKDLFIFDLDGTLVETKSRLDHEMSGLLTLLLKSKKVAIIGGGKYAIFQELFLSELKIPEENLSNLFLFPANSTVFYKYINNKWEQMYALALSPDEVSRIRKAFEDTFLEIGYKNPEKTYGELIEDRGTEVSFSVYGQDVVKVLGHVGVDMKAKWLAENLETKMKIVKLVADKIPDLEVRAAGFTTIDVTKKGIDKAYGVHQIERELKIPISKMVFIGDAIFPGGNDYAVVGTGMDYISVKGPEETKKIIKQVL